MREDVGAVDAPSLDRVIGVRVEHGVGVGVGVGAAHPRIRVALLAAEFAREQP